MRVKRRARYAFITSSGPPAVQVALSAASRRARAAAETRERNKARRHREWRQKRQDILVTFTGHSVAEVRGAVQRMTRTARGIGIAVRGRAERRDSLPPGHPPLLGSEGVKYVIMTVRLDCSMAQAVDLLKRDTQFGVSVVPIPSERCNVW